MEPKQMMKQMIQMNKAAFDNTFNAMMTLQDQTEKVMNHLIEQNPWIPEEGKKTVYDWIRACKKGREDFKVAADDHYRKVNAFFTGSDGGGKSA